MKHKTEVMNSHNMHVGVDDVPFSNDEYEVADILLNFSHLIAVELEAKSRRDPPLSWGAKGRRSALEMESSAPPGPSSQTEVDTPPTTATADAPSPLTPLSFFPSEPDDKPKRSKRKCPPKSNEELVGEINELTQRRESLKTELENLKLYHETLKTSNIELKARKQELSRGLRREETHLATGSSNLPVETSPSLTFTSTSRRRRHIQEDQNQIPIINLHQPPASVSHNASPLGIPDLNEPIWTEDHEAFEADLGNKQTTTAALAALARFRRRQLNKMKNSHVANKFRHGCI